MDIFYEESSLPRNSKKGATMYTICHIASLFFYILGAILAVFGFFSAISIPNLIFNLLMAASQIGFGFLLGWFKKRFNVSYDYCFVSGELRVSKVININKRKLVARVDCEDMIQFGDVDNPSFGRFRSDPATKTVLCTSNDVPADGKFFMYVLAEYNGKKLFVLECREELLMNILKFAKRNKLESDYVMQEKKQKQA